MRALTVATERTRLLSILMVLALAGGLTLFLFHDAESVRITLEGPVQVQGREPVELVARVLVPAGQRLPVAGVTLVVEATSAQGPTVIDQASCWGDPCQGGLRHAGTLGTVVQSLGLASATAPPTEGELWIRSEGYGTSSTTGYGVEVEPQRRREASDVSDAQGAPGRGLGYGGDAPVELRYAIALSTQDLAGGVYHLTFVVETGSRSMGQVAGPRAPLHLA